MGSRSGRTRVSRDKVRQNAREKQGGGFSPMKPDVPTWKPEKKGSYDIDVLPYEVKTKKHPDDVPPKAVWYKLPFTVHRGIGPENKAYVCPLSVGKPCPIHEDYVKLSKKGDVDGKVLKQLRGQNWMAMNIRDQEDKDKVAVYADNSSKFWAADGGLSKEVDEGDEANANFFDVKDGKTLHCRFSIKKFKTDDGGGGEFLCCSKIEMKKRKDMDEDKILSKTFCLEESLQVLPYDKLKEIYLQGAKADDSSSSGSSSGSSSKSSSGSASGSGSASASGSGSGSASASGSASKSSSASSSKSASGSGSASASGSGSGSSSSASGSSED